VGEDLHAIGIADAKQNAANLNAPMDESMEAIDCGKAQLLHDCPRVGNPDRTTFGPPDVQFVIQDRGVDDIPTLSLQAYKRNYAEYNRNHSPMDDISQNARRDDRIQITAVFPWWLRSHAV
jgi:hypothetical protein